MSSYHGTPLTEEEEFLLEKFRVLREKKKLLQKLKEKAETKVKPTVKRELVQTTSITPEDAKKKAERLVASGCVKISKASESREFKRARTSDKKVCKDSLSDQETTPVERKQTSSSDITAMREMYSSNFVRSGESRVSDSSYSGREFRQPRRGNTIFIKGYNLSEAIVRTEFHKFGTVTDIHFEKERSYGYVTYKTCEEAEKAIDEMNGEKVSGVYLQVSFARKQFHNDRGNNPLWSTRDSRSRDHREKPKNNRELQKYDGSFF